MSSNSKPPRGMSICPLCDGTKKNKVNDLLCTLCAATGFVSNDVAERLYRVRQDLKSSARDA